MDWPLNAPRVRPASTTDDALARASASIARLDQALIGHPLRPAFLYRARLDAVRRQAAVDGLRIDPWHLAALLEGLRFRMDLSLSIAERGSIFDAARHAFGLYQWLTLPDFDQEGEIQAADKVLAENATGRTPLLAAAAAMYTWLDGGRERPPVRAALARFWVRQKIIRLPVPLTGAAALGADSPWDADAWPAAFLTALAGEAEDWVQLLLDMERAWFSARAAVAGRRRNSRAAIAVDMLAVTPVISASSLANGVGMAVPNASALLAELASAEIVVEVTHRSKRRLFGLKTLAPLRDEVAAPRRPEPGRNRGRPPIIRVEEVFADPPPLPPLSPIERRSFDYSDLEHWMANLDQTIRLTKTAIGGSQISSVPIAPPPSDRGNGGFYELRNIDPDGLQQRIGGS